MLILFHFDSAGDLFKHAVFPESRSGLVSSLLYLSVGPAAGVPTCRCSKSHVGLAPSFLLRLPREGSVFALKGRFFGEERACHVKQSPKRNNRVALASRFCDVPAVSSRGTSCRMCEISGLCRRSGSSSDAADSGQEQQPDFKVRIHKTFFDVEDIPLETTLVGFYSKRRIQSCPPDVEFRVRHRLPPALRRIVAKRQAEMRKEAGLTAEAEEPTTRPPPAWRQEYQLGWSRGAEGHDAGTCRPCAFLAKGCSRGGDCDFCHLCDPAERSRRKRERKKMLRAA